MSEEYVLELRNITKVYPGVKALNDVSLKIKKGEILALIGENGAGKSTLIKTCSGAVVPTKGKIVVDGQEYSSMTPQTAFEKGIAIIYQEFNNVQELSVAENLFLGRPIKRGFIIDKQAMERKAEEAFAKLNIKLNPKTLMRNLTVGYQQMVEIAKAIEQDAKILIMDEPSAPLTSSEVETMFAVVRLLRERGVSIIYISHRLEEIFQLSDRVMVLRDGDYIDTLNTADTNVDELIRLMVGRDLSETYPPRSNCINPDETILELKDVSGNGNKNISFSIKKGEILGLGGLIGAGRTEIAQMIFGSVLKKSGDIVFKGKSINPRNPRKAIDLGIALVPEDRKKHGVMLDISVNNNINMPIYNRISWLSVIKSKMESSVSYKYKDELDIRTPTIRQKVKNLSGGNQQKVVLSKWLAANSELIIFDEPTRGIDVGAKHEIYKLMNYLVEEEGKSILLISSEMEELMGMSDRIIVLAEGEITGELNKEEFDPDKIMAFASLVQRGGKV